MQPTRVIHTPGPVWRGGSHGEDELLANSYLNSLTLAAQHGVRTVAFPSISTGVYSFPIDRAARIAVAEVHRFLGENPAMEHVTFVCFNARTYEHYRRELDNG